MLRSNQVAFFIQAQTSGYINCRKKHKGLVLIQRYSKSTTKTSNTLFFSSYSFWSALNWVEAHQNRAT